MNPLISLINNIVLGLAVINSILAMMKLSYTRGIVLLMAVILLHWVFHKFTLIFENLKPPQNKPALGDLNQISGVKLKKEIILNTIGLASIIGKFVLVYYYFLRIVI